MRIKPVLLLFLFASAHTLLGQSGANPPSVSWRQVQTPHFRVLFPAALSREARQVANTLQHLHQPLSASLGRPPRRISLVLQNQGVVSNGFVTLSPRRSEFFTTPPQDYNLLGTNNWLDLLALHEFRHIVQYEKAYQSRIRLGLVLFGQNGVAALSHAAVPNWFWEGDAVAMETAYSSSGRGRIPDFDLLLRSTLLERGPYSYNKQHLGSFKDKVPNHYVTGYHLVSHVRRHHPADVWSQVTQKAFDHFYVPFTFSRSLRQVTGKRLNATWRSTVQELDSLWRDQAGRLPTTPATVLPQRKNDTYTDYLYPQPLADGSVVALKTGLSHIPVFVRLSADGSREQKLFTPGILGDSPMLSVAANKIVWSEVEADLRWEPRNYAVIKTYDLETGRHQVLQRKTRLHSPALSPDGKTIAAIESDTANTVSLVLVDAGSGKELRRFASPGNDWLSMPRWAPDGRQVLLLRTRRKERSITLVEVAGGHFTDLLPFTGENIAHPVMAGGKVYYNSPYNGIENIYALDLASGQRYQVASRRYAGINPALTPGGDTLFFNDFSAQGYNVARMANKPAQWVPLGQVPVHPVAYYAPLVEQEGQPEILDQVPDTLLPERRYRPGQHLFRVHSWLPVLAQGNNSVSLELQSQDILSTMTSWLGYTRNLSENTGRVQAGLRYQGWFPVLQLEGGYGSRVTGAGDTTNHWQEKSLSAGASLPLNLTNSRFAEYLTLSADAGLTSISGYADRTALDEQANGLLQHLRYQASYRRSQLRSHRDLAPRFSQSALLHLVHTPFGGDYRSRLLAANLRLAFPGLWRHHALQTWGNFQDQNLENYMFSSPLRFPRGYRYPVHDRFHSFTLQYAFPIWYPDLALGPLLYFQRLKGNLFYDDGQTTLRNRVTQVQHRQTYRSVGLELSTDFNVMRLGGVVLDAGVRFSYLIPTRKPVVELMVANLGF